MATSKTAVAHSAISLDGIARHFGMSRRQLIETLGTTAGRPAGRARVEEMLSILERVTEQAGGPYQAMAWYRAEPLPAFGGRTAESLVKDGKAGAIREWLGHVALGAFV